MTSLAPFRDVTILHSGIGSEWCKFLVRTFMRSDDASIHSIDVDQLTYDNPPEIELSVRESYALILFMTEDFLHYMEANRHWFVGMLDKRDIDVTSVFAIGLMVDCNQCEEICKELQYHYSDWEFAELETEVLNADDIVKTILEAVDQNAANHKPSSEAIEEQQEPFDSILEPYVCELFPDNVKMNQDKIALVFEEPVMGEVTLIFEDNIRVDTVRINPYCASFRPPVLPQGSHILQVFVEGVKVVALTLNYSNIEFTSVELTKQFLGVSTVEALDEHLAENYRKSSCADETLKRLVDLPLKSQKELDNYSSRYPTALHWAAANGLKELVSQLLAAPGAAGICGRRNCCSETVSDLAEMGGYMDLKAYIDDFIDMEQCTDIYEMYVQGDIPIQENVYKEMSYNKPAISEDQADYYEEMTAEPPIKAPTVNLPHTTQEPEDYYEELTPPVVNSSSVILPPPIPHKTRNVSVPNARAASPVCGPSTLPRPHRINTRSVPDSSLGAARAGSPVSGRSTPPRPHRRSTESDIDVFYAYDTPRASTPPPIHPRSRLTPRSAQAEGTKAKQITQDTKLTSNSTMESRSQNELIDIQEGFKTGEFNLGQAEMLLNAWKERNTTGNSAASFREKQKFLHEFRQQHETILSLLHKPMGARLPLQGKEKTFNDSPTISEPIVARKQEIGSSHRRTDHSRTSHNSSSSRGSGGSDTFRRSNDSGCDMRVSQESPRNSGTRRKPSSENRKSLVDQFMNTPAALDSSPGGKPPPLPSRSKKCETKVFTKIKK